MSKFDLTVENVVAMAAAKDEKGSPLHRADFASEFGTWLPEKGNTAESLKGWCRERIQLYQKWIANLQVLAKDCTYQSVSNLSDEELKAILAARAAN